MDLQRFFPYRLARLAETVSQSMARVYAERFDLTRDEWRILAALAEKPEARTGTLHEHCALDKMQTSRALARLEGKGLVARQTAEDDRRAHVVRLQPPGRKLLAELVPMVTAREALLLEALSPEEQQVLDTAIGKLIQRAERLREVG